MLNRHTHLMTDDGMDDANPSPPSWCVGTEKWWIGKNLSKHQTGAHVRHTLELVGLEHPRPKRKDEDGEDQQDSAGRLRPLHPPPNNPPVKVSVGAGCVERDDRERDDVPACPYRAQGMRRNSNDRVEEHVMTNSAALFSFATHTHYCFCVRQKQSALIFLASFPPSFLHSSLIPSMDLGKMMCLFGASDVEGHASGIARLQHKSWCMRMT